MEKIFRDNLNSNIYKKELYNNIRDILIKIVETQNSTIKRYNTTHYTENDNVMQLVKVSLPDSNSILFSTTRDVILNLYHYKTDTLAIRYIYETDKLEIVNYHNELTNNSYTDVIKLPISVTEAILEEVKLLEFNFEYVRSL